jgi:hypothetical protein
MTISAESIRRIPTIQSVVYFIDLYILLYRSPPSPSLPQQTGWEVDEITLLTSSGSPTAGLTLFCNNSTNSFLFYFVFRKSVLFALREKFGLLV